MTNFDDLRINFKLREGGYKLILGLNDIAVKMFKQAGVKPIEYTDILYKIVPVSQQSKSKEYVHMEVVGKPLDKPHLDTDIKVVTSELMVIFYPKIIQIATNFVDLRVSKENKEAVMDKYG